MHPIIILWSTPRTTSTAFEWMMRMRGDMACFHEPFGEAWYKGDDAMWPRLTSDSPRVTGLTRAMVVDRMGRAALERPVFSKDMPHYIMDIGDGAFIERYVHSFLIRDPMKAIPSIAKRAPEWGLDEYGFAEHREFFDRVADNLGTPPPVIDSDDLLEDPHGIVAAWCRAVGVPFLPEALSWEPGARPDVGWYDDGSWHDVLAQSDGLKPQPRRYSTMERASAEVRAVVEMAMPHYQHLYQHCLSPEGVPA
ncbi:MAG: sulfotransferase family protein [Paracoccaceae bacterium]|nr:sulfotransferase family protein [Paracoccaceae bacterium]